MIWLLAIFQQLVFPQGVDVSTYPKIYHCEIQTLSQVYDADTITKPDCHLGMGVKVRIRPGLRLFGINAPEVRGEGKARGQACRDTLREAVKANGMSFEFMAVTNSKGVERKGKYGRPLGHLFIDGENMALAMVGTGCAELVDYD